MKYVATINGVERIYNVPDDAVLATEEQDQKFEKEQRIRELKRNLRQTDYQAI